jgi:glycine/D-amino acid oxidase-like deaminating enzyme
MARGGVDLTVAGAGVFGLSVAWAAVRRGARVRVVEAARIGAGASGGLVGALAPHAPDRWGTGQAVQLDALLAAPDWWAAVEQASGRSAGYARDGRLQPLPDAAAVARAEARAEAAALRWQGRAAWRILPAPAGWAPASATGLVVLDTLSARLHPRLALAALAAAVAAAGGTIDEGAGVDAAGRAAGPVVWATGAAGLADFGRIGGRIGGGTGAGMGGAAAGGGEKGQALAVALDRAGAPQIAAPGLHIVPHADGTVAIGSTSERVWDDPAATDAQLDALHARALALCPALAGAPVVARWAGLRPRAATRLPVLGAWPGRPGHFLANGGFKTGFALAPWAAEALAALILDGDDSRIPDAFRAV